MNQNAKTIKIRIVSVQLAVTVDNGVYCADAFCGIINVIQQRDYRLFIWNRNIDAIEFINHFTITADKQEAGSLIGIDVSGGASSGDITFF